MIEAKAEYLYLCFIFINSSTLTHHKEIFIKEYITKEERGAPANVMYFRKDANFTSSLEVGSKSFLLNGRKFNVCLETNRA